MTNSKPYPQLAEGSQFDELASEKIPRDSGIRSANPKVFIPDQTNSAQNEIMYVDDDKLLSDSVARILRKQDKTVHKFTNPREAEAKIYQLPEKSLIISDFEMPEMTGVELALRTHQIRVRNSIGFILTSGRNLRAFDEIRDLVRNQIIDQIILKDDLFNKTSALLEIVSEYFDKLDLNR